MIESIRESVVYMAHTHDGARVAMHCLWHGTAKVCKQLMFSRLLLLLLLVVRGPLLCNVT